MILLTGATGTTGTPTVAQLRALGRPFRIMSRDVARARRQFGDDLDYVEGDFARPETSMPRSRGSRPSRCSAPSPNRWSSSS